MSARERAETQANISLARQLSAQAQELFVTQPEKLTPATLLSIESLRRYPEKRASETLAEALKILPISVSQMTHAGGVNSVAFSPDRKWVASGSLDGTARVWDAASGQEVARMTHKNTVISVAFSPDGKWVASGSLDGTARVWDAATGQEVTYINYAVGVYSVVFSPDGKWVASGSRDGSARVWDAATGQEVARMTHKNTVNTVAFSPDGKWLASGSQNGSARLWFWNPENLNELACTRLERNLTHDEWKQYLGDRPYRQTCPNLPPGQ
jgi:WD40 repeat protein